MKRALIWAGAGVLLLAVGAGIWQGGYLQRSALPTPAPSAATEDPQTETRSFAIRGVIEGFYGKPWSFEERLSMFDFMADHHYNTYVYAPKDDPYQRVSWGDLYPAAEAERMKQLVQGAENRRIRFVYSISPGVPAPMPGQKLTQEAIDRSIGFSVAADRERLKKKLEQMRGLGVKTVMLSFDDVASRMKDKDRGIYGTDLGAAHVELANLVLEEQRALDPEFTLWFAPTRYHGVKDNQYWQTVRAKLHPDIHVIWTGKEIVSPAIRSEEADQVAKWLGRKPLVWDNYPVNDFTYEIDHRPQLFLGPLEGRDADLHLHTAGLLANPMIQPEASKLALATVGDYLADPKAYDPERAWGESLDALRGVKDVQVLTSLLAYARTSPVHAAPDARIAELIAAFWKDPAPASAATAHLRSEFERLQRLPVELPTAVENKALLAEINPWVRKLAWQGEAGVLAIEYLSLPPEHAGKAAAKAQLVGKLQQLQGDSTKIGEEVLEFALEAVKK